MDTLDKLDKIEKGVDFLKNYICRQERIIDALRKENAALSFALHSIYNEIKNNIGLSKEATDASN